MDNKRKWEYTLQSIADASGNSINSVRDHKQQGWLDPDDFVNVARYIVNFRGLHDMKTQEDEWGGHGGREGGHG